MGQLPQKIGKKPVQRRSQWLVNSRASAPQPGNRESQFRPPLRTSTSAAKRKAFPGRLSFSTVSVQAQLSENLICRRYWRGDVAWTNVPELAEFSFGEARLATSCGVITTRTSDKLSLTGSWAFGVQSHQAAKRATGNVDSHWPEGVRFAASVAVSKEGSRCCRSTCATTSV